MSWESDLIYAERNLEKRQEKQNEQPQYETVDDMLQGIEELLSSLPEAGVNFYRIVSRIQDILFDVEQNNDGLESSIKALESIGEDVSDARQIMEERKGMISTYRQRLDRILETQKNHGTLETLGEEPSLESSLDDNVKW